MPWAGPALSLTGLGLAWAAAALWYSAVWSPEVAATAVPSERLAVQQTAAPAVDPLAPAALAPAGPAPTDLAPASVASGHDPADLAPTTDAAAAAANVAAAADVAAAAADVAAAAAAQAPVADVAPAATDPAPAATDPAPAATDRAAAAPSAPAGPCLLGAVAFGLNGLDPSEDAAPLVARLGAWLAEDAARVVVLRGHADAQGNHGTNLWFSHQRAMRLRARLVAAGAAPERVTAQGFGAYAPVAGADPADPRNRRVVAIDPTGRGCAPGAEIAP